MSTFVTIFSSFLILYCIYQLASLAGLISEKSGTANIAIEGNMIIGATLFGIFWTLLSKSSLPLMVSLLLSIILATSLGSIYMMLLGYTTINYMADHIIAGTGMNMLAPALSIFMSGILIDANNKITPNLSHWFYMIDGTMFQTLNLLFLFITIVIVILFAFLINKTRFGLRLKSSGENPYALETSGISVFKTRYIALLIVGALSSLSGAMFATKSTFYFTVNGSGFLALGILILGQWTIRGIIIGSLLFSFLISIFNSWIFIFPDLSNISYLMQAIPFIIPLLALMIIKSKGGPKSVGKNFKKDIR